MRRRRPTDSSRVNASTCTRALSSPHRRIPGLTAPRGECFVSDRSCIASSSRRRTGLGWATRSVSLRASLLSAFLAHIHPELRPLMRPTTALGTTRLTSTLSRSRRLYQERPYHRGHAASRSICEAKHGRGQSVLRSGTTRESCAAVLSCQARLRSCVYRTSCGRLRASGPLPMTALAFAGRA